MNYEEQLIWWIITKSARKEADFFVTKGQDASATNVTIGRRVLY